MSTPIDLSQVRPPDVVETLDSGALVTAWRDRAFADIPEISGLISEADPAYKWVRTGAARELLVRARVNDGARACMLPTAQDADLENLAALFGIRRETLVAGDPTADPPVEPVMESDDRLRHRVQLFPGSISSAGPESAYRFHVFSADPTVKDVHVASPRPGRITLTVLAALVKAGDTGVAPQALLDKVQDALSAESVRPMGDMLTVQSAAIVGYRIIATVTIGSGPDAATVLAAATESVRKAAVAAHRLGAGSPRSALFAALHVPGVNKAALRLPAADVAATSIQAAHATKIRVRQA